ncbi:hypothetical protein ACYZUC_27650 [Pseudomonas sp. GT1P32]
MKLSFFLSLQISLSLVILALAVQAEESTSIPRESAAGAKSSNGDLQLELIKALTKPNVSASLKLDNKLAGDMVLAIKDGRPITDEMVISPASIKMSFLEALNRAVVREAISYGPKLGIKVFNEYPDFKNEIDGVSIKIPASAVLTMAEQAEGCPNNLDTISVSELKAYAGKCFLSVNKQAAIVSTTNSIDKTYLKALPLVSSLVDRDNKHLCMISVYKKDLWITAEHCLPKSQEGLERYVIVDGGKQKLIWGKVSRCKIKPCDVAYVSMPTPKLVDNSLPNINAPTKDLSWMTPLFIPGIIYQYDMSDSLQKQSANSIASQIDFLWSPVGKGFCRAVELSKNGCLSHTCNTVTGFSGAPIYTYDEKAGVIDLIAIHSGRDKESNNCNEEAKTNYAHLANFKGM